MTLIYELSCKECDVAFLSMTLYPEMQRCPKCDKSMKVKFRPELGLEDLEKAAAQ